MTSYTVQIDSREQQGWHFVNSTRQKLDEGDYAIAGLPPQTFAIERKATAAEFHLNLLDKTGRFRRELQRLSVYRRAIVLLEFSESELRSYPFASNLPAKTVSSIRVRGKYLRKLMHALEDEFPSIQFLFADGPGQGMAERLIEQAWADYGGESVYAHPA